MTLLGRNLLRICKKDQKTLSLLNCSAAYIWALCFSRIVKLTRGVSFVVIVQHTCEGKMNFLRGQDDFFQTANLPCVSVIEYMYMANISKAISMKISMFLAKALRLELVLIHLPLSIRYSYIYCISVA